ncbi:MAG: hypothetical protein QXG02_04335 [Candidatus Anstonellales archaeon]
MSFQNRLRVAKENMRKLARELSKEIGPRRPDESEWEGIKEIVHMEAANGKHFAYGQSGENRDRREGRGGFGHEERMNIYYELKNAFHSEWKKLRKEVER